MSWEWTLVALVILVTAWGFVWLWEHSTLGGF